jgi:uncharacterized protein (UPF0303 family)
MNMGCMPQVSGIPPSTTLAAVDQFASDFGTSVGGDWTADELLAQEQDVRFARFDAETAIKLGQKLLERADRDRLPIAFEVFVGDRLVFRAALPGSNAENDRYLASKLKLARETGHPTLFTSRQYRDRLAADASLRDERRATYGAYGGCVPLRAADGSVAGFATVSGLSEQDDHAMVLWAVREIRGLGEGSR